MKVTVAEADCAYIQNDAPDSEWWICDVESPGAVAFESDVCNVDVYNPQAGQIKTDVYFCSNDGD